MENKGIFKVEEVLIQSEMETGQTSDGFGTLFICGRLDLSMEESVCKEEYRSLFSKEEVEYCQDLLRKK